MLIRHADLERAHNAVRFMKYAASDRNECARWCSLAKALENGLRAFSCVCAGESLESELAPHASQIALAMRAHWKAWAQLNRDVAARRGWVPPSLQEEFGNAMREADEIREAGQFLNAALTMEHSH